MNAYVHCPRRDSAPRRPPRAKRSIALMLLTGGDAKLPLLVIL